MKKTILLFALLYLNLPAFCQDSVSYEHKIDSLIYEGYAARNSSTIDAAFIAQKLLSLGHSLADKHPQLSMKASFEATNLLGTIELYFGRWQSCKKYFMESDLISRNSKNDTWRIISSNQLGEYYKESYKDSLRNDPKKLTMDSTRIDSAVQQYRLAEELIAGRVGFFYKKFTLYTRNNLGECHILRGDYDSAYFCLRNNIRECTDSANLHITDTIEYRTYRRIAGYAYQALAWSASKQELISEEKKYLDSAFFIRDSQKKYYWYEYVVSITAKAEFETELGNYVMALDILQKLDNMEFLPINAFKLLQINSYSLQIANQIEKKVKNRLIIIVVLIAAFFIVALILLRRIVKQRNKIEEKANDVSRINDLGRSIASHLNLENAFWSTHQSIKELIPVDIFGIGLFSEEPYPGIIEIGLLTYKGEKLKSPQYILNFNEDEDQLAVYCVKQALDENWEEAKIIMPDVKEDYFNKFKKEFPWDSHPLSDSRITEPPHSVIYLPLVNRIENKVLGVITVQTLTRHKYTPYEVDLLETVASFISVAILNAKQFAKIQDDGLRKHFALSTIAHDTQTAQMSVGTWLDMIDDNLKKQVIIPDECLSAQPIEKARSYLPQVRNVLKLISIIIGDASSWAETPLPAVKVYPVDLRTILEPLIMRYRLLAEQRELKITMTEYPDDTKLESNDFMLQVIFRNMLDNAIKYAIGGTIEVTIQKENSQIQVKVTNMCESDENSSTEIDVHGTGLGFQMCRKIMEDPLLNGNFNYEKTDTTFTSTISINIK